MVDLLEGIDAVFWLVLVLLCFKDLRRWNRRFQELYDELKERVSDE